MSGWQAEVGGKAGDWLGMVVCWKPVNCGRRPQHSWFPCLSYYLCCVRLGGGEQDLFIPLMSLRVFLFLEPNLGPLVLDTFNE